MYKKKPSGIILKELDKLYNAKSKINILTILFLSPIYFFFDFFLRKLKLRQHKMQDLTYRTTTEKIHKEGLKKSEVEEFVKNMDKKKSIRVLSFGKNCFFLYKKN